MKKENRDLQIVPKRLIWGQEVSYYHKSKLFDGFKNRKEELIAMRIVSLMLVSMMIIGILNFAGCGGGGAELRTQTYTKTLGRELMDLHDSYTKRILTEKEYQQAKEKLLEQRTQ